MTGLDYFTFLVLLVLIVAGLAIAFALGALPGKIADRRHHPQADAIRVAGWFGLLTLGLLWPLALIWAYTRSAPGKDLAPLRDDVERLVERVAALERTEPSADDGDMPSS